MKKILIISYWLLATLSTLSAQKVGLVLSGGGAKGITHIGVIKALEENNIPIDYIAGTSMGAIVGGMYAMGMTTDEMIAVLKSKDFRNWSTGQIESGYKYYFRNADPKPKLMEVSFNINNLDSLYSKQNFLPTNLISSHQMNYAFVPLTAQANAVSGGDFDKLFVPFRCVASDIYDKKAVVFRYGVVGDAIRASMTYPFMFKPITIDNKLLFDGGIFNNFPVDVMRSDFKPDYIIGSAVSRNPRKPDQSDIIKQIENMIMNRTDYTIQKEEGILLRFQMGNVKAFDFNRVDEFVKIGYDSVMKHIDEIKSHIVQKRSPGELAQRRKQFAARLPELKFQRVIVEGVDSLQKKYVENVFHYKNDVFSLTDFKESYFKLISDDKILEVMPHAEFNSATGNFDLRLNVKTQEHLKLSIGGNISSSTSNQAYFGLTYQNLTEYAQTDYIDAQFGKLYNGLGIGTRIEIPSQKSWYTKLGVVIHKFDYFDGDQLFYADNRVADFTQTEVYGKLNVGFPIKMKGLLEFGIGYGYLTDFYLQNSTTPTSINLEDRSIFSLGSVSGRIEGYTLNNTMYPTTGYNYSASTQLIGGEESFKAINSTGNNLYEQTDLWLQFRAKYDRYFPLSSRFTLGTYGEVAYSSRKLLQNYTSTIIQALSFKPTPYSRTVFNPYFSANQFAAIGLKPIYNLTKDLHLRGEAYCFLPYQTIERTSDNSAFYSTPFSSARFMGETSVVYNFKIGSAGLYLNYSSAGTSQWNFGLNIGILLFNNKFIE